MKRFMLFLTIALASFSLLAANAEAKRMGGGSSQMAHCHTRHLTPSVVPCSPAGALERASQGMGVADARGRRRGDGTGEPADDARMWIPALLTLGLSILLGWRIFGNHQVPPNPFA